MNGKLHMILAKFLAFKIKVKIREITPGQNQFFLTFDCCTVHTAACGNTVVNSLKLTSLILFHILLSRSLCSTYYSMFYKLGDGEVCTFPLVNSLLNGVLASG